MDILCAGRWEGRSLRPSILIDRLTRLFPGLPIHSDVLQDRDEQLAIIGPPTRSNT